MKFTRREIPAILGGAAAAALKSKAQSPPDLMASARESKRAAAAEIARVELPMAIEPAFRFQA